MRKKSKTTKKRKARNENQKKNDLKKFQLGRPVLGKKIFNETLPISVVNFRESRKLETMQNSTHKNASQHEATRGLTTKNKRFQKLLPL